MRTDGLKTHLNIEFADPAEAPLPPDQVSFRQVEVEPYSDGRRVRVVLGVTPFQERPTIDLDVLDDEEKGVTSSSIVEATDPTMSVTLHLPSLPSPVSLKLRARLVYDELGAIDERQVQFSI